MKKVKAPLAAGRGTELGEEGGFWGCVAGMKPRGIKPRAKQAGLAVESAV